jgi:hypothetical protein
MRLFFYSMACLNRTTHELAHRIGTQHAENETALITSLMEAFNEAGDDWAEQSILVEEVI